MTLSEYTRTPEYQAAAELSQKAGDAVLEGRPCAAQELASLAAERYRNLQPWKGAASQ